MWQTYDRENEQTNEWEKQLTDIEIRSELKRILKYRFELNETAKQASKKKHLHKDRGVYSFFISQTAKAKFTLRQTNGIVNSG